VKRLAKDDANADKSGPWFLEKAHAAVKKLFARSAAPAGDGGKSDAEKKAAAEAAAVAAQGGAEGSVQRCRLAGRRHRRAGRKGEFAHLGSWKAWSSRRRSPATEGRRRPLSVWPVAREDAAR
jgi:hypothetical protein